MRDLRKKILHVVWSLNVGGAEKLVYDLAHAQRAAGFAPMVCSVNEFGLLGDRLREEGFPVFSRHKSPGLDISMVRWLRRLIRREKVAVVHAHQYSPMVYAVLAGLGLRGTTLVYTEHGRNYPEHLSWKRRLVNPLLGRLADHLVSISHSTRHSMISCDRLPAGRIRVIHNGVDVRRARGSAPAGQKRAELGIPEGCAVVGSAARLEEVKNLPMMLRAFRQVLAARRDTVLVVAGTGSLEPNLKRLAGELGIAEAVRFIGLRHDLPDLFRMFDVFLLSSHTEGISITLLEAMANEVPAVVTAVGGNPEVVRDGETGYLVPAGGDREMADRILFLLDHPDIARRMGKEALRRVEGSFSFNRMMSSYLELYGLDAKQVPAGLFERRGVTDRA